MKNQLATLALAGLVCAGGLQAARAADNCTPDVYIVYWGATAPNPSINQAAQNLYGTPLYTCSSSVKTYRGLRQLDPAPAPKTCVQAYVGSGAGSCEGVQALDQKLNNGSTYKVCSTGNTLVGLDTLTDETNAKLTVTLTGSDVSYTLCKPVIPALTREYTFTDTETKAFVIPFTFIVNKSLRNLLPTRRVINPTSCPTAVGSGGVLPDCPRVDFSLTRDQAQSIYAFVNTCDWRQLDPNISSSASNVIGAVSRVRVSGTRRNFNATQMGNNSVGIVDFENGTGDVVTSVNNNKWCGNNGARCGESPAGVVGGQTSPCASFAGASNPISLGYIGTDRCTIVDPGTPADPFDDYCARQNVADSWDTIGYNGQFFNKAKVRCGSYAYWSNERLYFDEDYATPGSLRESAFRELISQTSTDAQTDPAVVANSQMFFGRGADGAAPFPTTAYNTFCYQP